MRGRDTRIFSPVTVAGLCVTIGRYVYLFKRLTAVSAGRFYRFEHIETYSSGKVVAKSRLQTMRPWTIVSRYLVMMKIMIRQMIIETQITGSLNDVISAFFPQPFGRRQHGVELALYSRTAIESGHKKTTKKFWNGGHPIWQ